MKEYKVAAVSLNRNSFGLHRVVMIAPDGEAWAGLISLGDWRKIDVGKVYRAPSPDDFVPNVVGLTQRFLTGRCLSQWGFECPGRLPDAPADVIAQVWPQAQEAVS
jgi:hypothetical protein